VYKIVFQFKCIHVVLTSPKLPFPIDMLRGHYDSVPLPCDTVIIVFLAAFHYHKRRDIQRQTVATRRLWIPILDEKRPIANNSIYWTGGVSKSDNTTFTWVAGCQKGHDNHRAGHLKNRTIWHKKCNEWRALAL